jgi:hypothetical protein
MLKLDLPKVVAAVVTVVAMITGDIPVVIGIVLLLLNISYEINIK